MAGALVGGLFDEASDEVVIGGQEPGSGDDSFLGVTFGEEVEGEGGAQCLQQGLASLLSSDVAARRRRRFIW